MRVFLLAVMLGAASSLQLRFPLTLISHEGQRRAALAATFASLLAVTDPGAALAASESQGSQLFSNNCSACHVGGGNIIGFARAKTLEQKALDKYGFSSADSIVKLIREGKGIMPAYGEYSRKDGTVTPAKMSEAEMKNVSNYVLQRASEGWR